MKLPDYPAPGEPLRAVWGRAVVDALRSLVLQPTATVRVSHSPRGQFAEVTRQRKTATTTTVISGGESSDIAFGWAGSDGATAQLFAGWVQRGWRSPVQVANATVGGRDYITMPVPTVPETAPAVIAVEITGAATVTATPILRSGHPFPASTSSALLWPLCAVANPTGEQAVLVHTFHHGVIMLPGWYA